MDHDRGGFPYLNPVINQQRHLAFGMRIGWVTAAAAVLPDNRDGPDVHFVHRVHRVQQRDDSGGPGIWGMKQGQHVMSFQGCDEVSIAQSS